MARVFTNTASRGLREAAVWPWLRITLGLTAALLFALPAVGASFTAAIDRDKLVLGETASLTLTFEDCNLQRVPGLPNIPGLQITYVGPSQQTTIINGQQKSTLTLQFTVTPQQPGDFTIPALRVPVEGQTLTSQPLSLKVLREDPSAPPAEYAQQNVFLWPVFPKRDIYLREPVVLEVRLYVRSGLNVQGTQPGELVGDGFPRAKFQSGQQYSRRVGGVPFTVVPFYTLVVPSRTGRVKTEPWNYTLVLNPRDPFDFGFFSRRPPPQELPVRLDAQELQVVPLPTNNVPASFNGAVGNFHLAVNAGPTNVTVGDPVTVRIQLTGRGALDMLTLPDQRAWGEFKTYSSTSKIENSDPLGVQGTKLFEQVVAPQSADLKAIPPVEFSFFDPEARVYRTLRSAPVPLSVGAAATVAPVMAANRATGAQDAPPPAQDIVGLKQRLGTVAVVQAPLAVRPWFLALQCVPVLAWLAAVVWRKRADALANNPRLRRRKQVARVVSEGLADLRRLAAEKKSDDFFATLFRVLQEQIGERLDLPATAITEAVVGERLKPAGLADTACASLHELFQACNFARYAPVHSSQELAAIVPRVEAVIEELRRFEP